MPVFEKAFAKINLILEVLHKRADGYHELRTVFQSLALHDLILLDDAPDGSISLACDAPGLPGSRENLAWRAADLLKEAAGVKKGAVITLVKRIPVAAGLAGGSSDAAAVLRGLVRLWKISLKKEEMMGLAARLGSDVPFCLAGGTALGTGRGETVRPLPACPAFYVVLANPGLAVPTAEVYQAYRPLPERKRPDTEGMLAAIYAGDSEGILSRLANDLEGPAFTLFPPVERLKKRMEAAGGPSLLSGSGATVFSLFRERKHAEKLYTELSREGVAAWLTETETGKGEGAGVSV